MNLQPAAAAPRPESVAPPGSSAPTCSLGLAAAGQVYEVVEVFGDDPLAHRLLAAGLWVGACLELAAKAPFGDPMLFYLHGYRLALRRGEAERIVVRIAERSP